MSTPLRCIVAAAGRLELQQRVQNNACAVRVSRHSGSRGFLLISHKKQKATPPAKLLTQCRRSRVYLTVLECHWTPLEVGTLASWAGRFDCRDAVRAGGRRLETRCTRSPCGKFLCASAAVLRPECVPPANEAGVVSDQLPVFKKPTATLPQLLLRAAHVCCQCLKRRKKCHLMDCRPACTSSLVCVHVCTLTALAAFLKVGSLEVVEINDRADGSHLRALVAIFVCLFFLSFASCCFHVNPEPSCKPLTLSEMGHG